MRAPLGAERERPPVRVRPLTTGDTTPTALATNSRSRPAVRRHRRSLARQAGRARLHCEPFTRSTRTAAQRSADDLPSDLPARRHRAGDQRHPRHTCGPTSPKAETTMAVQAGVSLNHRQLVLLLTRASQLRDHTDDRRLRPNHEAHTKRPANPPRTRRARTTRAP